MSVDILNADGSLFLETGPRVLTCAEGFAEEIGQIAAAWAMAEGHLGCYFGILLETTPSDALRQLGKQSAAQVTKNAKAVAEEKLAGNELDRLLELLDKLDSVREQRNRVQHDIWSRREGDNQTLYAVHVNDYRRLFLEIAENSKDPDQGAAADRSIDAASKYATNASNAFTLEDLNNLRVNIESLSTNLFEIFCAKLIQG